MQRIKAGLVVTLCIVAAWAQASSHEDDVTMRWADSEAVRRALAEPLSPWAADAVRLMVERGVFIGFEAGDFRWRQDLTREEAALILARFAESYQLADWNPEELLVLQRALVEAQTQLTALERDFRALDDVQAMIERLQVGATLVDTRAVEADVEALERRIVALEQRLQEVRSQLDGSLSRDAALREEQLRLRDDIVALRNEIAVVLEGFPAITARLDEVANRLANVETEQVQLLSAVDRALNDVAEVNVRLSRNEVRLAEFIDDINSRVRNVEQRLTDQEVRLSRLEDTFFPERNAFYLAAALYDGDGLQGRVIVGNDAIFGALGARISADFAIEASAADVPLSLAGALTFRVSQRQLDGYIGLGAGYEFRNGFNFTSNFWFGDIIVGFNYRWLRNVSPFLEGRYRYFFRNNASSLGSVAFGIQLRGF